MAAWGSYRRDSLQCACFVVDKRLQNICEKNRVYVVSCSAAFMATVPQGLG
jgi:hypothetical protein